MLPVFAEALASIAVRAIQNLFPNTSQDKLDLLRLQIQQQTLDDELLKGQMEVNKAEAANDNLFVSGWRPMVGWVCAAAFAWQYLLEPILTYIIVVAGHPAPVFPVLDWATMSTVLFGMLGIGAMRSYDKSTK